MLLLIDNYDSFSYNLVQLIGGIKKERYESGLSEEGKESNYGIKVIRNDAMTVKEIEQLNPEYIILSPGLGKPADAGVPVAKHGNRSVSSKCGAADVLQALGANITISPEQSEIILKKSNFCFMFAQVYHKAMKYVAP